MSRRKLLFLSDSVSASSGLARTTRDLALRVHRHLGDLYEVASAGYGSPGSSAIPFKEYHLHSIDNWLAPELPEIWADFVGESEGILMCVWDLSRLYWLALPQTCPNPHLRRWVETARMKKWVYGPIDAEGPQGKVSHMIAQTQKGFDRVLDHSLFSTRITGNPDYFPPGVDTSVFYPRPHKEARELFIHQGFQGLKPDSLLLGIVATNQARKNWPLGMQTARMLLDRGHDVRVWAHTDRLDHPHGWSLGNLITDYGLAGRVAVTINRFTDDQLAWMYSACDVTLGIGPEGFGYPVAESLACGVPCVCGSYGAQAEFAPKEMQIEPIAYFHEGAFCSKRPAHDPARWADLVERTASRQKQVAIASLLPSHVDWNGPELWPGLEKWFREGVSNPDLERIKALNYDHHRRMTEDHNRIKAEEKLHPETANTRENLDDKAYRDMLAGVPRQGKILELGSASGGQWDVLREWSQDITGIDLFEPAVTQSQKEGKNIHLGFVEEMPFPDEAFDLICSRHVMEHVSDIQTALAGIKRVLKPGGFVAAATPHYFPDVEPAHIQQLRLEEWVKEYEKAGFKIVSADLYQCFNPEAHIVAQS